MEKRGVIEEGRTPPETKPGEEKQAADAPLEEHTTKRTADAAEEASGQ